MSEQFIKVTGKIEGSENVKQMINRSPETYRKAVLGWLLRENQMFVGTNKNEGVFRRKLLRKKNLHGGTWSKRIAHLFKGWISNTEKISMVLEMGFPHTKQHKIHDILATFTKTHTITNQKYMPIPIYKNIGAKNPTKLFNWKKYAKELTIIRDAENILYFDKVGKKQLLFVGVKKVRVKKQFDFQKDWAARVPGAMNRFQKAIDRATLRAETANG